jgi:glutathione S-transferase
MKLYYSPVACSLSPHIVLHEAGLTFDTEKVDLRAKKTASGADFNGINSKGQVPTLQLDNGETLTEGPAIVQYIADLVPHKKLAPAAGTFERYRLQEWLNYISSEIHKGFTPLFVPTTADEWKPSLINALIARFGFVASQLEGRDYLLGDTFTVADAYLFTTMNWCKFMSIDLGQWPVLKAYHERIAARPAVQKALQAEGITL